MAWFRGAEGMNVSHGEPQKISLSHTISIPLLCYPMQREEEDIPLWGLHKSGVAVVVMQGQTETELRFQSQEWRVRKWQYFYLEDRIHQSVHVMDSGFFKSVEE